MVTLELPDLDQAKPCRLCTVNTAAEAVSIVHFRDFFYALCVLFTSSVIGTLAVYYTAVVILKDIKT